MAKPNHTQMAALSQAYQKALETRFEAAEMYREFQLGTTPVAEKNFLALLGSINALRQNLLDFETLIHHTFPEPSTHKATFLETHDSLRYGTSLLSTEQKNQLGESLGHQLSWTGMTDLVGHAESYFEQLVQQKENTIDEDTKQHCQYLLDMQKKLDRVDELTNSIHYPDHKEMSQQINAYFSIISKKLTSQQKSALKETVPHLMTWCKEIKQLDETRKELQTLQNELLDANYKEGTREIERTKRTTLEKETDAGTIESIQEAVSQKIQPAIKRFQDIGIDKLINQATLLNNWATFENNPANETSNPHQPDIAKQAPRSSLPVVNLDQKIKDTRKAILIQSYKHTRQELSSMLQGPAKKQRDELYAKLSTCRSILDIDAEIDATNSEGVLDFLSDKLKALNTTRNGVVLDSLLTDLDDFYQQYGNLEPLNQEISEKIKYLAKVDSLLKEEGSSSTTKTLDHIKKQYPLNKDDIEELSALSTAGMSSETNERLENMGRLLQLRQDYQKTQENPLVEKIARKCDSFEKDAMYNDTKRQEIQKPTTTISTLPILSLGKLHQLLAENKLHQKSCSQHRDRLNRFISGKGHNEKSLQSEVATIDKQLRQLQIEQPQIELHIKTQQVDNPNPTASQPKETPLANAWKWAKQNPGKTIAGGLVGTFIAPIVAVHLAAATGGVLVGKALVELFAAKVVLTGAGSTVTAGIGGMQRFFHRGSGSGGDYTKLNNEKDFGELEKLVNEENQSSSPANTP